LNEINREEQLKVIDRRSIS